MRDVSAVLAAVSEGSNEVGIVYATDAASVADKVDIIAEAPAGSLETPVLYPAGLSLILKHLIPNLQQQKLS